MSENKDQGADAIPAEVYKAWGLPKAEKKTNVTISLYVEKGCIHNPPVKRKGNPQVCDNHRGISLLAIAGNILANILLNRLIAQIRLIPESQCGFRKDRGAIVMIFTVTQLQENCEEQNASIYTWRLSTSPMLSTQSDVMDWKTMVKIGCPPRFIAMVRHFHDGIQ